MQAVYLELENPIQVGVYNSCDGCTVEDDGSVLRKRQASAAAAAVMPRALRALQSVKSSLVFY